MTLFLTLILYAILIFIITIIVTSGLFLLSIRLGFFPITWNEFKTTMNWKFIKQLTKDICKQSKKW